MKMYSIFLTLLNIFYSFKNQKQCIRCINKNTKFSNIFSSNFKKTDYYNNENKTVFYQLGTNPRLDYPNENGQLTWYPIGFSKDFGIKPKQPVGGRR